MLLVISVLALLHSLHDYEIKLVHISYYELPEYLII
jgi:hypothetical protein